MFSSSCSCRCAHARQKTSQDYAHWLPAEMLLALIEQLIRVAQQTAGASRFGLALKKLRAKMEECDRPAREDAVTLAVAA